MAERMKNLRNLMVHELKDLYSAESKIAKALPKMAAKASNEDLEAAFNEHLEETNQQIKRLEEVCEKLDVKPKGVSCHAMEDLIKEGKEMMSEKAEPEVMDAGLIALAQKIEHYEIAGYGTVCTYAEMLDFSAIRNILNETLEEEKKTDSRLTEIAKKINQAAVAVS